MLFEPPKPSQVKLAERRSPARAARRVGSMVTGVVRDVDVVDVIEIVGVPLAIYVAHRLQDVAKNYVEPERTLLRPRERRI